MSSTLLPRLQSFVDQPGVMSLYSRIRKLERSSLVDALQTRGLVTDGDESVLRIRLLSHELRDYHAGMSIPYHLPRQLSNEDADNLLATVDILCDIARVVCINSGASALSDDSDETSSDRQVASYEILSDRQLAFYDTASDRRLASYDSLLEGQLASYDTSSDRQLTSYDTQERQPTPVETQEQPAPTRPSARATGPKTCVVYTREFPNDGDPSKIDDIENQPKYRLDCVNLMKACDLRYTTNMDADDFLDDLGDFIMLSRISERVLLEILPCVLDTKTKRWYRETDFVDYNDFQFKFCEYRAFLDNNWNIEMVERACQTDNPFSNIDPYEDKKCVYLPRGANHLRFSA